MGKPCDTTGQLELLDAIKKNDLEKVKELSKTADIHFDSDRAFYHAVFYDRFKIVQWMVSTGVDINCNDAYGVRASAHFRDFEQVEWYISNGADIRCVYSQEDSALSAAKKGDKKEPNQPSLYSFMLNCERKRKLEIIESN